MAGRSITLSPIQNGPNTVGFDHYFGISASLDMPPYVFIENDRVQGVPTVEKTWIRKGPAHKDFEAFDVLPVLTRKVTAWIDQQAEAAKAGKPFFLYLPFSAPHTPILPTAEWQGKSGLNAYGDFVMQTDWSVGQVLQALERNGLAENTLLIVTSDNGCSPSANFKELTDKGHNPSYHFRGHKADIFEGGHRMPFLVRWPGKVKAGSTSDQLICLNDLLATCADVLGAKAARQRRGGQRQHFARTAGQGGQAAARGPGASLRQRLLRDPPGQMEAVPLSRLRRLELSRRPGKDDVSKLPRVQLYDLSQDVGEKTNVEARHPEVVERLTKLLEKYVADGRSTPGKPQKNTTEVKIRPNTRR